MCVYVRERARARARTACISDTAPHKSASVSVDLKLSRLERGLRDLEREKKFARAVTFDNCLCVCVVYKSV